MNPKLTPVNSQRFPLEQTTQIGSDTFTVHSRYCLQEVIGRGSTGLVVSAKDTWQQDEAVAVKKVFWVFDDPLAAVRTLNELQLMRTLSHPNLLTLRDIHIPGSAATGDNGERAGFNDIYLVTDRMGCDLHTVIRTQHSSNSSNSSPSSRLRGRHVSYFTYQLLCGLQYLHSAGVVHRDLKPGNILVDGQCNLKICDFGMSCGLWGREGEELTEYVTTRWYRAPEVMLGCARYGAAVDVWALGCVLAEMVTGQPLFPGREYREMLTMVTQLLGSPSTDDVSFIGNTAARQFMLSRPTARPSLRSRLLPAANAMFGVGSGCGGEGCVQLIESMLRLNPADRITARQALSHPLLREFRSFGAEAAAEEAAAGVYAFRMGGASVEDTRAMVAHITQLVVAVPPTPTVGDSTGHSTGSGSGSPEPAQVVVSSRGSSSSVATVLTSSAHATPSQRMEAEQWVRRVLRDCARWEHDALVMARPSLRPPRPPTDVPTAAASCVSEQQQQQQEDEDEDELEGLELEGGEGEEQRSIAQVNASYRALALTWGHACLEQWQEEWDEEQWAQYEDECAACAHSTATATDSGSGSGSGSGSSSSTDTGSAGEGSIVVLPREYRAGSVMSVLPYAPTQPATASAEDAAASPTDAASAVAAPGAATTVGRTHTTGAYGAPSATPLTGSDPQEVRATGNASIAAHAVRSRPGHAGTSIDTSPGVRRRHGRRGVKMRAATAAAS